VRGRRLGFFIFRFFRFMQSRTGIRGFEICIPATCPAPHGFTKYQTVFPNFQPKIGGGKAGQCSTIPVVYAHPRIECER
jgi:hypothetical protein